MDKIDGSFGIPIVKSRYPYLMIVKEGEELPILLQSIPEGNLPLLVLRDGRKMKIKEIEKSAIIINRLLRLYDLSVALSKEDVRVVTNIEELIDMEGFDWMV